MDRRLRAIRRSMTKELYEKICAGDQVRENLIALREAIKDEENRREFAYLLGGNFTGLCGLLEDEDPKIRKNAALVLGRMESDDLLPVLFAAYEREETLFIRADFLKAIALLDYEPYTERLEQHLEELRLSQPEKEAWKHISEEIRMLQSMVMKYRRVRHHHFTGQRVVTDLILVTNRCQREATARQITHGTVSMLGGGVRVKGARVKDVLGIRTWNELLFPVETEPLIAAHPEEVAKALAKPVLAKAEELHADKGAFLFRIELKSRISPDKKKNYIHKISDVLEAASGGGLINSVTDYELELRLLERKDGTFAAMLKVLTIPAKRFAYRREYVASSISPVNAALTAELARPYLTEGAQVLDPFCGVGTMLIERNHAVPAGIMYGVDIYGEAITKAHNNTDRDGSRIYYVNKDFFAFEHSYPFDEIITDMPQVTQAKPAAEIRRLYLDFFDKAPSHLKESAVLVLYATEPRFVSEGVRGRTEYRIEKKFTINEKNGTSVFVIRYRKQ